MSRSQTGHLELIQNQLLARLVVHLCAALQLLSLFIVQPQYEGRAMCGTGSTGSF